MNRPQFSNNQYSNNSALYGVNIGSYAVRIVSKDTGNNLVSLNNIGSGIEYTGGITLSLVDYDDQEMVLENESTIKITPISANSSISGNDYSKVSAGVAEFPQITFVSKAGTVGKLYLLDSKAIDDSKVKAITTDQEYKEIYASHLNVSFRYCQPGEQENSDGQCYICSYGTYTLDWNSTRCINCMNDATCTGGSVIEADSGFWRKNFNSTSMIE